MEDAKDWEDLRILVQNVRKLKRARLENVKFMDVSGKVDAWCGYSFEREKVFDTFMWLHPSLRKGQVYAAYNELTRNGVSPSANSVANRAKFFGLTKHFVRKHLRLGEAILAYSHLRIYEDMITHGLPREPLRLGEDNGKKERE